MTEQQTPTSEVLNRAADLIEKRGWGGGWSSPVEDAPLCLEGGIAAAVGVGFHDNASVMWKCPAYAAVQEYLGIDSSQRDAFTGSPGVDFALWKWNDTPGRTAAEVIEVLRATAVIEQSRESAPVEVSA